MVTGMHPDDVDLFDYVEDDLPQRRRAELEVHLASCARCAEQVARVQAGRDALREAQYLKLSQGGRDAIFVDLPPQPRARRRRRWPSLKQVAAVAAPAAALVAVVVALSTLTGNGDLNEAGGGAEAPASQTAAAEASGGSDEEASEDRASKEQLLFTDGSAADIATALRAQGLDAEVVNDQVEVRSATRAEVERALEGHRYNALQERRDGSVRIVILP
jgi:anti-sigma factor RsiW